MMIFKLRNEMIIKPGKKLSNAKGLMNKLYSIPKLFTKNNLITD